MAAYCWVTDHPFYAVTGEDGAFTIDNLDPGEYEIEVWHERLGTQRARVTIAAAEPSTVDFTFKRPGAK
ncbi:MAG: carboxypeptidase regulatory-like domain-containing protein [Candidatus Hydrogenedentes bacterium]|nr:carboxypeptidase regulatory-like domain-containing protein [Candidatus Hydrogenedentota bacterium]